MKEKISEIKSLLQNSKDIVITVHRGPDADALGSALALSDILKQLDHNVTVISPNNYASFLHWMKGHDQVVVYSEDKEKAHSITDNADLIFLLDLNSLSRTSDYSSVLESSSAFRILIDHHLEVDNDAADIIISDSKSCSTAKLLFKLIKHLGYKHLINIDVAECIYAGIMTDTGSFKYSSTTSETHMVAAELINLGANNSKIHDLIYDNYSEKRIKLLGYCLNEKLQVFSSLGSALISLTEEELKKFNFKKGDTEGIVNYALSIEGIKFAVFIAEKEGMVKLSLRSKGDFQVNKIAKRYFNGGGHMNAAGGVSEFSVNETIKQVISIFEENKINLIK